MRHLTIVYTINDEKAFEEEAQRIRNMTKPSDGEPFAITAYSLDHEINRLDLICEAINSCHDKYMIEQIYSANDVGQYSSIEEFINANP